MSVYFTIRNALPKSGTYLLGHPVYVESYLYILFLLVIEIAKDPFLKDSNL
jgi:hypothetical protein